MIVVGLTGGIGAGKSAVSGRLAARGAVVIDADAIVRELQQPGQRVFASMVEAFGPDIVGADGQLDRQAVADRVFNDRDALNTLNGITHPAVQAEMATRMAGLVGTDAIVIMDIPLLTSKRPGMGHVIVVDTPVETAVERLVEQRGLSESDARARVANQISRDERLALADFVIDNSGDLDQLEAEVDRCWAWLGSLDQAPSEPRSEA
jgi:dephospho-CoA kinase